MKQPKDNEKCITEKSYEAGYAKGHSEGWDDACLEYEIDEETSKSAVKQLADIDTVLARRAAIDNIPNRVDKILFMFSELQKATITEKNTASAIIEKLSKIGWITTDDYQNEQNTNNKLRIFALNEVDWLELKKKHLNIKW